LPSTINSQGPEFTQNAEVMNKLISQLRATIAEVEKGVAIIFFFFCSNFW